MRAITHTDPVDQMLADATHCMAQPGLKTNQVRKALGPSRLRAEVALSLVERLAIHGAAIHPEPERIKTWLGRHVPVTKWIPAAVMCAEQGGMDVAIAREWLGTKVVNLHPIRHWGKFFIDSLSNPNQVRQLMALASTPVQHTLVEVFWSNAYSGKLSFSSSLSSMSGVLLKEIRGRCASTPKLWEQGAYFADQHVLEQMLTCLPPVLPEDAQGCWKGLFGRSDLISMVSMVPIWDACWSSCLSEVRHVWTQVDTEAALDVLERGHSSPDHWALLDERLGHGVFTGVTHVHLITRLRQRWLAKDPILAQLMDLDSMCSALDHFWAHHHPRLDKDPGFKAVRESFIRLRGEQFFPHCRVAERAHIRAHQLDRVGHGVPSAGRPRRRS